MESLVRGDWKTVLGGTRVLLKSEGATPSSFRSSSGKGGEDRKNSRKMLREGWITFFEGRGDERKGLPTL